MALNGQIKQLSLLSLILITSLGVLSCASVSGKKGGSAHLSAGETKLDLFGLGDKNSKSKSKKPSPKASQAKTKIRVLPADPEAGIPLTDTNLGSVTTESLSFAAPPQVKTIPTYKEAQKAPVSKAADNLTTNEASKPLQNVDTKPDFIDDFNSLTQEDWQNKVPQLQLAEDLQEKIKQLEAEIRGYKNQINALNKAISKQWGKNAPISDADKFVKYTDNYESREIADFQIGKVIVETLDETNPRAKLKEAIVAALLTPSYAENPNLFNDKNIDYEGPYLLSGQVVDNEGVEVKWEWRANRYADYLIENKLEEKMRDGKKVYSVEFDLVKNHSHIRGKKYETLVRNASIRYKIPEVLIYAIMKVESNFNPYATSHIPAYGLMQVVPATAGRDVYRKVKRINATPSASQLYNPVHNIDIGTGYIHLLQRHYLKDIKNPQAREYAVISAYNGGAGNVLKSFHSNRKVAINIINRLSAQEVYARLVSRNPSGEARKYLAKVIRAKQEFKKN